MTKDAPHISHERRDGWFLNVHLGHWKGSADAATADVDVDIAASAGIFDEATGVEEDLLDRLAIAALTT